MAESQPFRTTRYYLPAIMVSHSGTIADHLVTGGYIWQQGRNRDYYQNLDYATTTSLTPVPVGSVTMIPKYSGHIVIDSYLRANNNATNQGVGEHIVANGSTLINEHYESEPVAGNEQAFALHYELSDQPLSSTIVIVIEHHVIGSGEAITKVISLVAEEI